MPRRNNAPVNRSSRRRNNTYRRGTTISLVNELGQWVNHRVIYSNSLWTQVQDLTTGASCWIPTKGS